MLKRSLVTSALVLFAPFTAFGEVVEKVHLVDDGFTAQFVKSSACWDATAVVNFSMKGGLTESGAVAPWAVLAATYYDLCDPYEPGIGYQLMYDDNRAPVNLAPAMTMVSKTLDSARVKMRVYLLDGNRCPFSADIDLTLAAVGNERHYSRTPKVVYETDTTQTVVKNDGWIRPAAVTAGSITVTAIPNESFACDEPTFPPITFSEAVLRQPFCADGSTNCVEAIATAITSVGQKSVEKTTK